MPKSPSHLRGTSTFESGQFAGPGRGYKGKGRGHNKGTITVTIRALKRQKEPSVTPIFYKLRQNTVTAEVAGSSPVVPAIDSEALRSYGDPNATKKSRHITGRTNHVSVPVRAPSIFVPTPGARH